MQATQEAIVFDDRREAGRKLAEKLQPYRDEDTIVLALPRGGVVVGYEVARALDVPFDLIVARKLGAPEQPELGIGAIGPGGVKVIDEYAVQLLGITPAEIGRIAAAERTEMERRQRLYQGDRPAPRVQGRTVILVDDGLATGVTARAALRWLRLSDAKRIILAVPVCAGETLAVMRGEADEIVCLATPRPFRAVGLWYRDFRQVTDGEVVALLERARRECTAA